MSLFHSPQPTANHGSTLISYRGHSNSSSTTARATFSTLHQIHLHYTHQNEVFQLDWSLTLDPDTCYPAEWAQWLPFSTLQSQYSVQVTLTTWSHYSDLQSLFTDSCLFAYAELRQLYTPQKDRHSKRSEVLMLCSQRSYTEPNHLCGGVPQQIVRCWRMGDTLPFFVKGTSLIKVGQIKKGTLQLIKKKKPLTESLNNKQNKHNKQQAATMITGKIEVVKINCFKIAFK